jgi:replication factor A2
VDKDYSQESLRPVTIKQILDAQVNNDEFKIDNNPISQVTFVCQIRNISMQATNITYKVDDGTGSIEVKLWIDSDAPEQDSPTKSKLVENAYVRVWGKLKDFHNRKHVGAQIIRPVEDMNEVSYHLLEATVVHLHFTKGPLNAKGGPNASGEQQQQTGAYGADASTTYVSGPNIAGFSGPAKKVFAYLNTAPQSNEGLHQQEIAAALGIDTADVAKAGNELLDGGLIYTTVDEQTWAVLESD